MPMDKIIRTIRRYTGRAHVGLREQRVVILSVNRGDEILDDDRAIGRLRRGDRIEFAPLVRDDHGGGRMSWVTSDGFPGEFGPIEGWYEGLAETWIVMSGTRPAHGR